VQESGEKERAAMAAAGNPNNWYQSTWFKGVFDFAQK
jgi:hypothetical protein